jgi:hypothetical protein
LDPAQGGSGGARSRCRRKARDALDIMRIDDAYAPLAALALEPFPIRLNHILVIASEAWRSSGSDSNERVGSPRFARDDGVFP